jgi:hypothetical protein
MLCLEYLRCYLEHTTTLSWLNVDHEAALEADAHFLKALYSLYA